MESDFLEMMTKTNNNGEGLANENKIFPSHFNCIICGKPGSGKTTLLKFLLRSSNYFYKKFDHILIMSPSIAEFSDLFIKPEMCRSEFSCEWITETLERLSLISKSYINVLLIIDDFVSQLDKNRFDEKLTSIAFNRRHLLKNGMLSIIQTTQKYNVVPTRIRCSSNVLILFNCNRVEILTIEKELIFSDVDFQDICKRSISNNSFLIYNINSGLFYKNFTLLQPQSPIIPKIPRPSFSSIPNTQSLDPLILSPNDQSPTPILNSHPHIV